jgi:hypothetical protein
MVIRDNSTRWNSTYDSILRAIDLYPALALFSFDHEDELREDLLTREDWDDIKEEAAALRPFKDLTIELQSRATSGNHGSVWETLPALELLLGHMEELKERLGDSDTRLAACVNNSWKVLTKYYDLTDRNHTVYAMATILNPTLRSSYFERHWNGTLASYIPTMKTACYEHWKREYQPKTPSAIVPRKRTLLEAFLHSDPTDQSQDEWERWVSASPIAVTAQSSSLFRWHVDNMEDFPTLHQMALDTLSIPAMSTECERVFSSTKKLLSPHRCSIKEDLMEASECLKAWWDCGIIVQN